MTGVLQKDILKTHYSSSLQNASVQARLNVVFIQISEPLHHPFMSSKCTPLELVEECPCNRQSCYFSHGQGGRSQPLWNRLSGR